MNIGSTRWRILPASVAALTLRILAVPGSAAAASTATPYFMPWKVGTPLPSLPAGATIMAWPDSETLGNLAAGQRVAATTVGAADIASATNSATLADQADQAGIVNLEVIPQAVCGQPGPVVFDESLGAKKTFVGQSYATFSDVDQTFVYGDNQSSSLGVGFGTSTDGPFSASGSVSVSSNSSYSVQFPSFSGVSYNHWTSDFLIGMYDQSCNTGGDLYYVRPYAWAGGDGVDHPAGAPATPHCVPILSGTITKLTGTTATTFNVGYSAAGFNGSARTGYAQTAEIRYHYTAAGVQCGRDADPGQGAVGFLNAAA